MSWGMRQIQERWFCLWSKRSIRFGVRGGPNDLEAALLFQLGKKGAKTSLQKSSRLFDYWMRTPFKFVGAGGVTFGVEELP